MRNVNRDQFGGRTRTGRLTMTALLAMTTLSSGCDDIFSLKQENPSQLTADAVFTPANAQLMTNGAIADFECAFHRFVVGTAIMSDELANAFQNTELYDLDRRTIRPTSSYAGGCGGAAQNPGIYTSLSTARGTADVAYEKLNGWTDAEVPNRTRLLAQAATYGGFSLVLMGEAMCSSAINLSAEMTPAQLFTEAITRLDRGITHATAINDATLLNLARLGRARALLNSGNAAAAATEAANIPANFAANITTDLTNGRRQNMVSFFTVQNSWATVDPTFRGLTLEGAPDPRVRVTDSGRQGTAAQTRIWTADKFPAVNTAIALARYAEAQLIIAEARAAANDLTAAATAINNARNSGRTGMPQYSATGQTQAQVQAQVIEERRRELYLEGHRFGDIRRLNLPLTPAAGTPYTQGGGTYGDIRCFPLPDVERNNNPNISRP